MPKKAKKSAPKAKLYGGASSSSPKSGGQSGSFFKDPIKTEGQGLDSSKTLDMYRD